ncbi:Hypothetical predicted protein [Olea europaea subsp. europaea]|uniref:Uncharacterized protein n=1 Tax=Olea europaea subsp. europaea TaxID=158383 RepID=A0A8S0UB77_OLEEU|nr:Hypothetical predicted protein [Olea europaea subsp. europaea]
MRNYSKLFEFEKVSSLCGSFRENIRCFLQDAAELEDYRVNGMPIWCILIVSEHNGVFPLYTIEETVEHSVNPFCDHCKLSGWGHHYVSKRRYHFIIPANESWNKPVKGNFSELQSHNLYGLIHCNGYGHLICINGFKENSIFDIGSDFMDLWDRLCTTLKAREISVCDDLKKRKMELRLIHGVAYGRSWFGNWGYKFSSGSFGVTEQKYDTAIQIQGSLGLDKIITDFKDDGKGMEIKQIIDKYRELSEKPLITISDLLQYIFANPCGYESKTEDSPMSFRTFVNLLAKGDCRWASRRLEHVLVVIIKLLNEHKANNLNRKCGMSRHELREEARKYIGDTGLIDFVLKSIKSFTVNNQIIRRTINPLTRLVEFTIYDVVKEAEGLKWPISRMDSGCRYSRDKLEQAAKVVVNILKENRGIDSMARQELRDRARECIRDTGLIDYVLKSLDNAVLGNQIVYRSKNPTTNRIEYSLVSVTNQVLPTPDNEVDLYLNKDILFLYENVLLGYSESNDVGVATQLVLDSKQFVKVWKIEGQVMNQLMTLACKVLPSFHELETELTRPLSPGVTVMIPPGITIGNLKVVAQGALRDTYCIMDDFVVKQIGGLRGIDDDKVLSCTLEPGAHVWVRGCGMDLATELRYEDGTYKSTMDRNMACNVEEDDVEVESIGKV